VENFIDHVRAHYPNPELQVQPQDLEERSNLNQSDENAACEFSDVKHPYDYCYVKVYDIVKSDTKSETTTDAKGFVCSMCDDNFLEERSFVDHVKYHVNLKKGIHHGYHDDENRSSDSVLLSETNSSENLFEPYECSECSECPYAAARKSFLKTHIGEKQVKFSRCPYSAAQKLHHTNH
jgi:hypothetical protein